MKCISPYQDGRQIESIIEEYLSAPARLPDLPTGKREQWYRVQAAARFKLYFDNRQRDSDFFQYYLCRPKWADLQRYDTGTTTAAIASSMKAAMRATRGFNRLANMQSAEQAHLAMYTSVAHNKLQIAYNKATRRDSETLTQWNMIASAPVRSAESFGISEHEKQSIQTRSAKLRYRAETNRLIGDVVGRGAKKTADANNLFGGGKTAPQVGSGS